MTDQSYFRQPEIDRQNVEATVKWFNATKGFGFVAPTDGSPDAFIHISVVQNAGYSALAEGATIRCDLSPGQRGPQVAAIHHIEMPEGIGEEGSVEGTVKFFNGEKGFGFVTPDNGGKDVFVHVRALQRSGIEGLEPEQRVRMTVRQGEKGPMAESVSLA